MDLDALIERLENIRANNPVHGRLKVIRETKKRNNKQLDSATLHIKNSSYHAEDCIILKFEGDE